MGELPIEALIGIVAGVITVAGIGFGVWRSRQVPQLPGEEPAQLEQKPGEPAAPVSTGLAARFFTGLSRSRGALSDSLSRVFGGEKLDEEALEALEDALISADVGVKTAMALTETLRSRADKGATPEQLRQSLRDELRSRIGETEPIAEVSAGPLVILVVGVNGSGKTTSIGKLANRYKQAGKSVILAAGDTFRAGAIEQLKVWGERAGVPVIAQQEGSHPAAVVFDAVKAGKARGVDVIICDTAGRLQAHRTMMEELEKVNRTIDKAIPGAPHEVLIVLDATSGQNALMQARAFKEAVGVTGVVLTKLDGTAKGGVVVAVRDEIGVPVKLVGLGEGIDDLRNFDPDAFVDALIGAGGDPG